jgi:DNA-binding NtrC family response regulator
MAISSGKSVLHALTPMPTILVAEDEYLLADDCASLVRKAGFDVAGPFATIEEAFGALEGIQGALLDIDLGGTVVFPLIDELERRQIPVVIYTGYQRLPARYAHLPCYLKPDDSEKAVERICKSARNGSAAD